MTNFNYNIAPETAALLALNECGLDSAENIDVSAEAGCWRVEFNACELRWTCYVDAADGSVPGVSSEPCPVETYPSYARPSFLRASRAA